MNKKLFEKDPRSYALEMVDQGLLDGRNLAHALLMYMSTDDVKEALDGNELSPRFDENDDDESEEI